MLERARKVSLLCLMYYSSCEFIFFSSVHVGAIASERINRRGCESFFFVLKVKRVLEETRKSVVHLSVEEHLV